MRKIDAHIHCYADHPDCIDLFDRLELKLFNICVAHDCAGKWRAQATAFREIADADPQRFAWCTSFDAPIFAEPDYADRVIAELDRDLAAGAVACKVWKNIGMEFKKPSGEFLMIDDPVFDPIFAHLEKIGVTVLAHIGEPLACWQPLSADNPHSGYYRTHPEWHMHGRADFPSHRQIIDARDRMLAKFPELRVVGAHLGSLEYDVAAVVDRLDRYPNFAVDTSARMRDLTYQDTGKVRQFFAAYPDRILFGTDIVQRDQASALSAEDRQRNLTYFANCYQTETAYFESAGTLQMGNRQVQGLELPESLLEKFYHDNAARWYPGL